MKKGKLILEEKILDDFKRKTEHLRLLQASTMMQSELALLSEPFHKKLKEIGYSPEESRIMLKSAFNHKPPPVIVPFWTVKPKLTVFDGR